MKTITLNHWLSIQQDLKKTGILCIFLTLPLFAYSLWKQDTSVIIPYIGMFSTFPITIPLSIRAKDTACQWEQFSLTLPISRKDVVTGEFRFFAQLTALSFSFSSFVCLGAMVISYVFSFEKPMDFTDFLVLLPIVLSVGMVGQCFSYLISLIGKDGIGQMWQMLVVFFSCIPYVAPILLFASIIDDKQFFSYLTSGTTVTLVVLLTGISYVLSVKLMEKKEF